MTPEQRLRKKTKLLQQFQEACNAFKREDLVWASMRLSELSGMVQAYSDLDDDLYEYGDHLLQLYLAFKDQTETRDFDEWSAGQGHTVPRAAA